MSTLKRRYVVTMAVAVVTPVALSAACAFPSVTFVTEEAGLGTVSDEASVRCSCEEGTGDAASPPPVSTDGAVDARAPHPDDAGFAPQGRPDGGARIADASVCAERTPCDCDEDGFARIDCPVDPSTITSSHGEPLKPGDCDDLDPLRFPGQGFLAFEPSPTETGDWNCDGIVEPDHLPVGSCKGTGVTGCIGGDAGVMGGQCGDQTPWVQCRPDPTNGSFPCFWQPTGEEVTIRCR